MDLLRFSNHGAWQRKTFLQIRHPLLIFGITSANYLDVVQMPTDVRQFFGRELYVRTTDVFLDTLDVFRVSPFIFCFDNPFSISTSLSSKAMDASP